VVAGWGPLSSLSKAQRNTILGLVLALVLAVAAVVITSSGDDDQTVRAADDDTSTTQESTTSTTEATTTTESTTTTTTAPTTTVPPTTAPPTTVAPAPPPAPSGSLDMGKVLSFAKSGSGGSPPATQTGATTCPAHINRPSDAGDDSARDITDWYLTRYCSGVYRGVLTTNSETPALQAFWIRIDSKSGGCEGTDHVVIGWHDASFNGHGAVIATPGCGQSAWDWVERAGVPVPNGAWLQLDFRGSAIGNPSSFNWRGYVQAVGESGSAIDRVPNSGPEHFVV